MIVAAKRQEEFLWGILIPTIIVVGTWLIHLFDFFYYFFPIALILGFIITLIMRKWGAALGLIMFIALAWLLHWILPIFWSWIMADNEIIKRLMMG